MEILNKIKGVIIGLIVFLGGIFVWRTTSKNSELQQSLFNLKDDINKNNIKIVEEVSKQKEFVTSKEKETTINIVSDLSKSKEDVKSFVDDFSHNILKDDNEIKTFTI